LFFIDWVELRRGGDLMTRRLDDWKIWRLEDEENRRLGDWGDRMTRRLEDLGDWMMRRLGDLGDWMKRRKSDWGR